MQLFIYVDSIMCIEYKQNNHITYNICTSIIFFSQAPASMSPAHLHQYAASLASPGQLSESLPASQVS